MQTITLPELQPGETYAGLILNDDGTPSHHLILIAGDNDGAPHQAQIEWAASIGGELPTRREQSLLFANCKAHFKRDWYWSADIEAEAGFSWTQHFSSGNQYYGRTSSELRARAVRRLIIQ